MSLWVVYCFFFCNVKITRRACRSPNNKLSVCPYRNSTIQYTTALSMVRNYAGFSNAVEELIMHHVTTVVPSQLDSERKCLDL